MAKTGDYTDLAVWQLAIELAAAVYQLARSLPLDERFELSSQLRRASVSVPSNIAEGWAKRTPREFIRSIDIASGSLREIETQAILCERLKLVPAGKNVRVLELAKRVGQMLIGLRRKLAEALVKESANG
jgi:four helix bundle protein